jgi:hypothetical protein
MSKPSYQYFFIFSLSLSINLPEMIPPQGIRLIRNQDTAVTAIEVNASGTETEARSIANNEVKKLLAILSLYHNQRVEANCLNWRRINPGLNEEIFVKAEVNLSASVSIKPVGARPVDLTKAFASVDSKFWRQIGHFQKGNSSSDAVEKYREYYQVLEEENSKISLTEKALRHAVNHPLLNDIKTASEVTKVFGIPYFDPLNVNHKAIVNTYAEELRRRALTLLLSKNA